MLHVAETARDSAETSDGCEMVRDDEAGDDIGEESPEDDDVEEDEDEDDMGHVKAIVGYHSRHDVESPNLMSTIYEGVV